MSTAGWFQVGQVKTFSVSPLPTDTSSIYSYVWGFWDGSSTATAEPFVSKRLNLGGQPGTGLLNYSCTPVQVDGQSVVLSGSIFVNTPPVLINPVVITANDQYFPFQTVVSVRAYDVENEGLTFRWYDGDTFLSNGTTAVEGAVNGTWTGNGTTVVNSFTGTRNDYELTVRDDRTLKLYVIDGGNGTSTIDVVLRGRDVPAVVGGGGAANSTEVEGSVVPRVRVGPGASVDLSVYGKDQAGGPVEFEWQFRAADGWTSSPATAAGVTVVTADGGYQNTYTRAVDGETLTAATKDVRAYARVISSGGTLYLPFDITLLRNNAPANLSLTAKVNGTTYNLVNLTPIAPGAVVELSATATDADSDVVDFYWQFTQPFTPSPLQLWGGKVVITTTGYTTGQTLVGSLIAYDRFGSASALLSIPAIPFS